MISKEDFNKVWKDSTREAILNQYYYDYIELRKVYSIIKEAREYIEEHELNGNKISEMLCGSEIVELKEILDKVGETDVKDKR